MMGPAMFGWFRAGRKQRNEAPDSPRTAPDDLAARVEALEARQRRLADDLAELDDTIARKLDKYRKRVEREEAATPDTEAKPLRSVPNGEARRVLPFDPLAIRRGPRGFPGGGR